MDHVRKVAQLGLLSGAMALALLLSGCSTARLSGGEARVLSGTSLLRASGDTWLTVAKGETIPDGSRVRTGLATARLELQQGEVWLGPSATVQLDGEHLRVERGEVIVHSDGELATVWESVRVTGKGVYRLSPGASPRAGVYEGTVTVSRPGEERRLPRLRQIGLGSRRLAAQPDPLYYELNDGWDRELLPQAIAFDEEVAGLARGIDREYGVAPRDADFYASFAAVKPETVPVLAATTRRRGPDGTFGPPSDALVTLFVASALASAKGTPLEDAVRQVADQRARGARWGLLAVELDIAVRELAAAVDLARERREEIVPDPRRPRPRPTPTSTGRPTTPPTATPTPRPTGSPSPTPSPPPDPQNVIERALEGILGGGS